MLDEATSALDKNNEQLIQQALDRLAENRTTITIAHRLSSIKDSDMIFVIDQGQVVQVDPGKIQADQDQEDQDQVVPEVQVDQAIQA